MRYFVCSGFAAVALANVPGRLLQLESDSGPAVPGISIPEIPVAFGPSDASTTPAPEEEADSTAQKSTTTAPTTTMTTSSSASTSQTTIVTTLPSLLSTQQALLLPLTTVPASTLLPSTSMAFFPSQSAIPGDVIAAIQQTETGTEPAEYTESDGSVKDPFEEKPLPKDQTSPTESYFSNETAIIDTVDKSISLEEKNVTVINQQIINEAKKEGKPLGVLAGINLPSMFDLTRPPPNPKFIVSIVNPVVTIQNRPQAFLFSKRLIRILRAYADGYYSAASVTTGIEALSNYRAGQVLEMTIALMKRNWLVYIGALPPDDFSLTPEYQALLHLTPDWQVWLVAIIQFAAAS